MRSTLPSLRDLLASGGFRLRSGTRADCARCEGLSRGTVGYNSEVAHCFRCGWSANRFQLARELGLAGGPREWRRLHRLRKKPGSADTLHSASNVSAAKGAQARVPVLLEPPLNRLFPPPVQPEDFRCGGERGPADQPPQAEACATRGQRASVRRESRRRAQNEKEIRAFTRWREARLRQVSDRYWGLSRAALRAAQALRAAGATLMPDSATLGLDNATLGLDSATLGPDGATLTLDGATLTLDSAGRAPAGIALTPAEQELAWDALARFYHAEAELNAAFDLLMCSKAGAWLEDDARIEELFVMWSSVAQALLPVRVS